ncbi:tRNA lysidine(34) synthetase TilS [Psychrobacter sp. LV10R520-6]|uniref:tRNA lysidine(34) synthetase TilS n=1 Tax=Psychrobacter sp. LV10R520-6 TaxID=1415574 RepID=UPI0024CA19D2|nr:tRNA lysidine(34) synthetase TilS [Psychrobacter sp. LV10R520-6]SNT71297.1 tRNA(Ile)-lysidine synthase [Psychrobacter sp. LV10R520-6]
MTSSAILPHPIEPLSESPIDETLATALLNSVAESYDQLHGRRIWLACSGGRDSLALAALCLQLYQQGKLPFLPQLLHVDHGLQSDSSNWAMHVAKWAHTQKMPCQILHAQVKGNDEQAARQARYQVMLSHINQDDVLLLAHHADDQAETVLMRLIQGAGVNGLSGMQPWRVQTQGARRNILWRPWLSIRRSNISTYAKQLKLPYIDDPTNDNGDNVRSGMRREIMPALAAYNANVIDNIARSAQLLTDAQATVSAQAAQDLQQTAITILQLPPAQRVLSIPDLHLLPLYRQRQLLHYWLGQDEPLPPSKQLIDDALSLTQRSDNDHQTQLDWQGRKQQYTIWRYREQLYRLSTTWLKWLTIPIAEQRQTLATASFYEIDFSKTGLSKVSSSKSNSPQKILTTITLRTSESFIWQLPLTFNGIGQLLSRLNGSLVNDNSLINIANLISSQDEVVLKIEPLGRQQRVQTALATRPQAGKKLYQTLSIPLWLRDSLVVVSLVSTNAEDAQSIESPIDLPILLLSPFDSWVLGLDKTAVNMINDDIDKVVSSLLSLKDSIKHL